MMMSDLRLVCEVFDMYVRFLARCLIKKFPFLIEQYFHIQLASTMEQITFRVKFPPFLWAFGCVPRRNWRIEFGDLKSEEWGT